MSSLDEATEKMLKALDNPEHSEAEYRCIETLTFSNAQEIITMLDTNFAADWSAMPVWARNLAFRLACLLEPTNAELLRNASFDLHAHGPDWDTEADLLYKKADELERNSTIATG